LAIEHQKENIDKSFSQRKSLSPNRLINESFDGVEELELSDDGLTDILEEDDDLQSNPTMEEEAELRRVVQTLFELEESLLNQHMSNIQVRPNHRFQLRSDYQKFRFLPHCNLSSL